MKTEHANVQLPTRHVHMIPPVKTSWICHSVYRHCIPRQNQLISCLLDHENSQCSPVHSLLYLRKEKPHSAHELHPPTQTHARSNTSNPLAPQSQVHPASPRLQTKQILARTSGISRICSECQASYLPLRLPLLPLQVPLHPHTRTRTPVSSSRRTCRNPDSHSFLSMT